VAQLNSYMIFNGNCREAMEFYQKCLGGELTLNTVGSTPAAAQMPSSMQDKIMHSSLKSGNITLMGSDMVEAEGYRHGNTLSLCLICDSRQEIESLFAKFSQGGRVRSPLKQEFFGTFGAIADKFGFNWMFMFGLIQN
jgi:PhnB protein